MNSSKNFILITAGDPASISTEITIKAIESKKRDQNIKSIVITDANLVEENKALLKSNIKIHEISDIVNFTDYKDGYFNIIALKLNNKINISAIVLLLILLFSIIACEGPPAKKRTIQPKHNYIVLLDLSDRLIVQANQPERDKELISYIYSEFEERVKKSLYIKSRDEIIINKIKQCADNYFRSLGIQK